MPFLASSVLLRWVPRLAPVFTSRLVGALQCLRFGSNSAWLLFQPIHNFTSVALSAYSEFVISDRVVNAQNRFRPCCMVGAFPARMTMPGHPSLFDRQIKAFIVMRAKDVPSAVTRCWIKFRFIQCTFRPEHNQDDDPVTLWYNPLILKTVRISPPSHPGLRSNLTLH